MSKIGKKKKASKAETEEERQRRIEGGKKMGDAGRERQENQWTSICSM